MIDINTPTKDNFSSYQELLSNQESQILERMIQNGSKGIIIDIYNQIKFKLSFLLAKSMGSLFSDTNREGNLNILCKKNEVVFW